MREIKFRAWNEELKRMAFTSDEHFKTVGWWGVVLFREHNVGEVLMQYTGLKDKNGVEIYEGDVVDWPEINRPRGVVKYIGHAFWIQREGSDSSFWPHSPTVIGNIYEHGDLLK